MNYAASPDTADPIRILVVDDHPILRDGIALIIGTQPDMVVVGQAEDGDEAIAKYDQLKPDIALMDLRMSGKTGLMAIEAIMERHRGARIIVLTTYRGDALAMHSLRAGAAGYLLKSSVRTELLNAIRQVHAGRRYLQPDIAAEIAIHAIDDELSQREIQILQLIANGRANKEIGRDLGISEDTVKTHIKGIFAKLDVGDRTHAVTVAARRGMIEL